MCPNTTDTLFTQAGDSHQWYSSFSSGSMGSPISGATDSFLVVSGFGYFTVETTVAGCTEASAQVLVDEWAFLNPVIQSSGQNQYCIGDSTEILMPGGSWVNIQWYLNGSPIPGANNNNYWVTGSGTYVVFASPSICPTSNLTSGVGPSFTFTAPPMPTIPQADTTICPGESVMLTTQSFTLSTWYRSPTPGNLGVPAGGSGTSFQATTTGYYSVQANNGACIGVSNQVYVEVLSIADPVISTTDSLAFCPGDSAELTLAGTWNSVQWQLNTQDISGATGSALSVSQSGAFTVVASDSVCPQSALGSNTIVITVYTPIAPIVSFSGNGIELTSTPASSYQWWTAGAAISGAINQTYTPLNNGYYTVATTDANGCSAVSDSFLVSTISILESTGVHSELVVWPNPSQDHFLVSALETKQQLRLLSITGQVIRSYPFNANGYSLDGVAPGIYIVELRLSDRVLSSRLMVE